MRHDARRATTGPRRRSAPVWCLLVALTLVPTLGMGLFATREASESAAAAAHAARTAQGTEDLAHLLNLLFALTSEQMHVQVVVRAESLGTTAESASAMIGYDVEATTAAARRDVDGALATLSPELAADPALVGLADGLSDARRDAAEPSADPALVEASFLPIVGMVEDAADARAAGLVDDDHALLDRRTAASIESFSSLIAAFRALNAQVSSGGKTLWQPDDREARSSFHFAVGDFRRAVAEMEELRDPTVREGWRAIAERPEIMRLERATDAMLADPAWATNGGTQRIADVFADTFLRVDLLADLSRRATTSGVASALDAEQAARRAYQRSITWSVIIGVAALTTAFMISRSISGPLRLLARRASSVTDGDLTAPDLCVGGPTEVRTVSRALDEATESLRRIEEQAQALAVGRLSDPVLSATVPGRLGESLQASVAQLSRSLREQDELRQRMDRQAHCDVLTGLANRLGFLVAAEKAVSRAQRSGYQVALLFLDLDGFKRVNDVHGHHVGDEVLKAMAERLVGAARSGDTVARLGGDQFVAIAEPVAGIDQAMALGRRFIAATSEPVTVGEHTAQLGASIGVSICQDGRESAVVMLAEADQAAERAKRAGGGGVEVFDAALRTEVANRTAVEEALRTGIPAGELELHYQPVVASSTGDLQGFEALVRWDRPGHGLVPPMTFIPVAEGSDLVIDLGRWVLQEATSQLATWSTSPELARAHMSVNISGRHLLNTAVVDDVRDALERSGLKPSRLVVEITETVILADLGVAVAHLEALRDLGVRIALDDFGTGYTSIGQLGLLPIDILKIDRSFVNDLHRMSGRSIVELMVGVAHTLELGLVAEGVETVDQLGILQELACDDIQGYYISRPLPVGTATTWATSARSHALVTTTS